MRKQYKISAKYFLNKRLRAQEENGLLYWPLYIQMSFHRKSTQIKTGYYMNDFEFEKYQNGCDAFAFFGDFSTYKENGLLMPNIIPISNELNKELDTIKNIVLLLESWLNKDYDITNPRFDNDIAFFKNDVSILGDLAKIIDYKIYECEILGITFNQFLGIEKQNTTPRTPTEYNTAEMTLFHMLATSYISLYDFKNMCEYLKIPFFTDNKKIKHWIFAEKINPNQSLIEWINKDYPNNYKGNALAEDFINCIKCYSSNIDGISIENILLDCC